MGAPAAASAAAAAAPAPTSISFFERYLTVWVLACMVVGGLVGYFAPSVATGLKQAEVGDVSIPIGVLLWLMIFPMLLQIDFASLKRVAIVPGPVLLTSFMNFAVQPFLAYGVAVLFFRVFYVDVLTSKEADAYIAGCVLLGTAPCTAMVFVWSLLVGGNAAYTLIQVAVNDLLVLALYIPIVMLLLGVTGIELPYDTVAR